MASTRKSRNANKRFAKVNEEWAEKDATPLNKNRNRKRKISDMLGSQWSREELERFYESYRKCGKDWRKVAATIRNRTSEMVEALFNMNKAYLSLPEGTATAAGLIAMMTDHYNMLEGSNSDRESNDVPKSSRKPQKQSRGKYRLMSKTPDARYPDLLQYQSASSSYGCLSLLKKKRSGGNRPRAVGKRTPRVLISSMYNRDDKDKIGPLGRNVKPEVNAGDDEGLHVAALALAEASQRGGSPEVSRTPGRRVDRIGSTPVKSERKNAESEMDSSKLLGIQTDGECPEGSLGSREAENGDDAKEVSCMMDNEGVRPAKTQQKLKRSQRKKPKAKNRDNDQFDDDREACSGTEEGRNSRKVKDETDMEVMDGKAARGSKASKNRSRQLFFGDESPGFDALQTLADLSVNILLPSSAVDSESSAQLKEEKKDMNSGEKLNVLESKPRDKLKTSPKKDKKRSASIGADSATQKNSKLVKGLQHDVNTVSETQQQSCACSSKTEKRKRKPSAKKMQVSKAELNSETPKEPETAEVSVEEGRKSSSKVRRAGQASPAQKQGKVIKPQEISLSNVVDLGRTAGDVSQTNAQVATENQGNVLITSRKRRKMGLIKALAWKSNESNGDHRPEKFFYPGNGATVVKEKLSHCLSSRLLRRWCVFEWFYSAIDYPWFAKSEFVEYLNHVRLGHVPRLTRAEWGVIRSSLGKPRRLSKKFLQEEREKLQRYRDSVRVHYAELRAGVREGLPNDLARPLSVGQRVIACHPKTREIHDGSVLTVDRNRCRVQFDRPELGVEFVMDIDCMPLNPLENFPEALRRQNMVAGKYCNSFLDVKFEDQSKEWKVGSVPKFALSKNYESIDGTSHVASSTHPMSILMKQAEGNNIDSIVQAKLAVSEVTVAAQQAMYSQPCTLSQIQEREADIRALAELSRALDKKEALLIELRHMNEEVSGKQKDGDTIKDSDHFKKQYAMVLVQLRDANDQVSSALLSLRQRNTYHGSSSHPWTRPVENSGAFAGPPDSYNPSYFLNQDSGSQVMEIVDTSRQRAKMMVDVALQAMCSLKEGEDAYIKIGEALSFLNINNSGSFSTIPGIRRIPVDSGHANSGYQDNMFDTVAARAQSPKSHRGLDAEAPIPSELISSCVAIMLMIQACTERQYPPAEVAQILDSAVASLQPCCPGNLPIFREIETFMGVIKNQMLALIPTPATATPGSEASILKSS
ncbi:protein ALWAYS EARLY 2 isoform X3 [Ananas comosus]|uniref:Protein ALWAYS EARLY 2 isoform X3 n=1 Tax=Ananas comosus TaxID=4615 RepID=A0A6P5GJQ4_ANACO|nr:protein ALWAYS EARLY 2 isoform X3 [Ananas comosus]